MQAKLIGGRTFSLLKNKKVRDVNILNFNHSMRIHMSRYIETFFLNWIENTSNYLIDDYNFKK